MKMHGVQRPVQYTPEQLATSMVARGIDASEGISKLPSHVVKGYARINKPIDFELGYAVGVFLIYPYYENTRENEALRRIFGENTELAKIQSSITLAALHNRALYFRKGSHEQLAGIVAAVMDYDIGNASYGFLSTGFKVCDNCGMGGDNAKSFNDNLQTFHISSASAILAASSGLKVVKHGSHGPQSNKQRTGSSDFVEFIGIKTNAGPEVARLYLEKSNFGYTESIDTSYKSVHIVTQRFSQLSSMNDIIGPMTNPVDPAELTVKIIGTNQIIPPMVVARAYALLNERGVTAVEKGLVVRGLVRKGDTNHTIDEISVLNAGTEAVLLYNGNVTPFEITFETFGFNAPAKLKDLIPERNKADDRINYTCKVLDSNAPEGAINTLIANTAALIALERFDGSTQFPDFRGAAAEVKQLLRERKHQEVLDKISAVNAELPQK